MHFNSFPLTKKNVMIVMLPIVLLITVVLLFNLNNFISFIKYELFSDKSKLTIVLNLANPTIDTLAADPENKLILVASVVDYEGNAVQNVHVTFTSSLTSPAPADTTQATGIKGNSIGKIIAQSNRTNEYGEAIASYSPPSSEESSGEQKVFIAASISGSNKSSIVSVNLANVPVVMIHGYQSTSMIFENFKEYLQSKSYPALVLDYASERGVVNGAQQLDSYLTEQRSLLLKGGFQASRFDIIAHSMGGLAARYYSTSDQYVKHRDVRKIIFISVPHRGSPLAALGAAIFNDTAIYDMIPESNLLSQILPQRINRGLNSTIQVANILGQYDEVVTNESASLDQWGIQTEVFSVGENNLTVDKILNGSIMESANHRAILSNKRVFERVAEMLDAKLPYPFKRD